MNIIVVLFLVAALLVAIFAHLLGAFRFVRIIGCKLGFAVVTFATWFMLTSQAIAQQHEDKTIFDLAPSVAQSIAHECETKIGDLSPGFCQCYLETVMAEFLFLVTRGNASDHMFACLSKNWEK